MTERNQRVAQLYKEHRANTDTLTCDGCGYGAPRLSGGNRRPLWTRIFHAHHVVPLHCGGEDAGNNMALLCLNCHALVHGFWSCIAGEWTGPIDRAELRQEFASLWSMGLLERSDA